MMLSVLINTTLVSVRTPQCTSVAPAYHTVSSTFNQTYCSIMNKQSHVEQSIKPTEGKRAPECSVVSPLTYRCTNGGHNSTSLECLYLVDTTGLPVGQR
ncbi:uncharacterized protein LOC143239617 isoform X2 [Tachypleus tridentatus]|uniref:uncharacterized protein LOC143239617 isoform X2 n=1 Tax=Tachypleus tridentatus TaxID=6853 RepID=UPI003FCF9435